MLTPDRRSRRTFDRRRAIGIVVAFLGVLLWAGDEARAGVDSGHTRSDCRRCHLGGADVDAHDADRLTTTQESMCGRCHRGAVEASHPTGFVPDRPLPAAFPLDWKREMTCSTCHEMHDGAPGRLRVDARGPEFCLSCHEPQFFDEMPDGGMSILRSAHLDANMRRPAFAFDAYSMACMECHAERASAPRDGMQVASLGAVSMGLNNHPIGFAYGRFAGRPGYRPAQTLPREMLLPDGKVSCLTCHRAFTRKHGETVDIGRSTCMECHDK